MLESLEQEYKREEDWCGGADKLGPNSETDHVTPMISKHLEQKEAFLKVRFDFFLWFSVFWQACSQMLTLTVLKCMWKATVPFQKLQVCPKLQRRGSAILTASDSD